MRHGIKSEELPWNNTDKNVNAVQFTYKPNGQTSINVMRIRDFGVILDSDVLFNDHVSEVEFRTLKMLRFVIWSIGEIRSLIPTIIIIKKKKNIVYFHKTCLQVLKLRNTKGKK